MTISIKQITALAHFADDYDFNIKEEIKGLGMYTKYNLYFNDPKLDITYCKPCFSNEDKFFFIRCGNNVLFQGKEVKEEIEEFEKIFNKISKSILEKKQSIIGLLLVQADLIKAEEL